MYDRSPSDGALSSAGVVCRNAHALLRCRGSSASQDPPGHGDVAVDDGAQLLKTSDVVLSPGDNSILFTAPTREPGTYTLRQLCAKVGQVQFVLPHIYPIVQYEVYSQEPQLRIEPLTDNLLAGLPQRVQFTVVTGHYSIKKGDSLQLSNTDSMPILHSSPCSAYILSSTGEHVGESVISVQCLGMVTSISLPLAPPYHTIQFQLEVLCHIPPTPSRPETQRLTNGELQHWVKSRKRANSGMAAIDQKISIDCPWSIYSTLIVLTFNIPFKSKHTLLSVGKRKYIRVCVQNVSEMDFLLVEQSLSEREGTSLELQSLNAKTQQLLYSQQSLFYVWEVKWAKDPPLCIQCVFSASFCPTAAECSSYKPYHYEFQLENVSTLYSLRAEIKPAPEAQDCHTGALCVLEVCITRLAELGETEKEDAGLTESDGLYTAKLLYEVVDNSSNWAVCGKSSGLVSMPVTASATHRLQMEVMPLFAGHLPFPNIKLFKYLPHNATPIIQTDTDGGLEKDSLSLLDEQTADTASIRSRGSVHSLGAGEQVRGSPRPHREPFGVGQVFNGSWGQQVLVLPGKDDHVLDVNVT